MLVPADCSKLLAISEIVWNYFSLLLLESYYLSYIIIWITYHIVKLHTQREGNILACLFQHNKLVSSLPPLPAMSESPSENDSQIPYSHSNYSDTSAEQEAVSFVQPFHVYTERNGAAQLPSFVPPHVQLALQTMFKKDLETERDVVVGTITEITQEKNRGCDGTVHTRRAEGEE